MNIKNTLFNLSLLGIGGLVGYVLAKKQLQNKYQDDLADVQDFYYKKLQEIGVMEEDFEPQEMTDEELLEEFKRVTGDGIDTGIIDEVHEYINNSKVVELDERRNNDKKKNETSKDAKYDRGKGRPIINYNKPPLEKILAELEEEGDKEVDDPEEENVDAEYEAEIEARAEEFAQRRYENQMSGEPYCIDHEEFKYAPDEYETEVLYYYAQDRVLCEDDDSIVDEEEELVGLDYEDILSMQTIAWVRNDRICKLYEIHRIDESYQKVVTNAVETPREREFRLNGRRKQALDDRD